ncbi:MAG: RnfABCDGE type electron transport complex subunit D [Lachnospiraceae bacterium]|nr:RnfABCDGE type electron transport complex subunit D [Lachnospiraceae bacterium]
MSGLYNISSSPHTRSRLSTGRVMMDVVISLLPAACVGVWHFGLNALLVILISIGTAVLTELLFDIVAKRPVTVTDGSAVVTGLLLALCLSPAVPLFIPILGSMFAILFVKCFFGGVGKNFMNPALAGRCFLLISFSSTMTNYQYSDAVSSATPLVDLGAEKTVNLTQMFLGTGTTTGVIGCSILALMIGGLYLLVIDAITWEIPVATLAVFALFVGIFGGHGFNPQYIVAHLLGGGIVMGAFFMATDPVTSPVTTNGQLLYGALIGLLAGIFRIYATAADSVSYAIIIGNLATPLIDEFIVPLPFGFRKNAQVPDSETSSFNIKMAKPALNLFVITLVAGVGLAGVFNMTKDTIEEQKRLAKLASYEEVLPEAETLEYDDKFDAAVEALGGGVYGTDFGKAYINEVIVGKDASGATMGYVVSSSSNDGFDGTITLSVGVLEDGTVTGIAFTELAETAGMGMRCGDPEFKDQFAGRNVERFTLNKAGGSTADDEIDSVSGASISSGAVVNAVNAALAFLQENAG